MTLPRLAYDDLTILDVGCADGYWLSQLKGDRYGIDPLADAVASGQVKYPDLHLCVGRAESLPYEYGQFDVVMSRISLCYSDLNRSLPEVRRVLTDGGQLFLMMHDWRMQIGWLWRACKDLAPKRVIDHGYIFPASWVYACTGVCLPRPWKPDTYELFQTQYMIEKQLQRYGFSHITMQRTDRDWIIEAVAV